MNNLQYISPRILYGIIVLSILLLLVACTSATPIATPALPTATQGHALLYALTFENEATFFGWHVGAPGQYEWLKNVKDGKYVFEYPSGFLESQDFDFGDVQIGVEVEFLVKTRAEVGLACRMQPGASGRYYFSIANDGHWSIRKGEAILTEGWSDHIKPDKNLLAARCVGDSLTLLVNDAELGSAQDDTFVSGSLNFGYAADSVGAGAFDNITVEDWGDGEKTQADATSVQSAVIEPATPTLAPVPTATPEGLLYANHFDGGSTGLDGWTTYEIISTRHGLPNDPNIELIEQRLRLNGSNSQPLYLMYDASFPLMDGWMEYDDEYEFWRYGKCGNFPCLPILRSWLV